MIPFETSGLLISSEEEELSRGKPVYVDSSNGLKTRYRVGQRLAKGATSVVYFGERVADGHRVAIKRIKKEKLSQVEERRVRRECSRLGLLVHPNIVQLVEVIEDRVHISIVTNYIDGCSIGEMLFPSKSVSSPMDEELTRRIFAQLLRVVNHLHENNLIHRDIKPANLLLDSRFEHLSLCDFGLCTRIDGERGPRKRASCGTLSFAAPEMLTNGIYVGPEVDMWSCGATLFSMLTGRVPFHHTAGRANIQAAIRSGTYEWPRSSTVSYAARDLVNRLLTVESSRRATMAEAREHPWLKSSFDGRNSSLLSRVRLSIARGALPRSPDRQTAHSAVQLPRFASYDRQRHSTTIIPHEECRLRFSRDLNHSLDSMEFESSVRSMNVIPVMNIAKRTSSSSFSEDTPAEVNVGRVISFLILEVSVRFQHACKIIDCFELMTRQQFKENARAQFGLWKDERIRLYCYVCVALKKGKTKVKSTEQLQDFLRTGHRSFKISLK